MEQKKSIALSGIICIVIILAICGMLAWLNGDGTQQIAVADSYEELMITVELPEGKQRINIWQNEEDEIFYFFLPSGTEKCEMYFENLGKEGLLILDNSEYTSKNALGAVQYEKIYNMEMLVSDQTLGNAQLVFMKSDNISSLFVETASQTVDNIHQDKEVKEKAKMALFDSEGQRLFSDDLEYIKTRGLSSFTDFEKKSYQIKLLKETSLLGMPKDKTWLLLANAIDDTFIKNELVFRFAQNYTNVPSIQGEYVDLYVNGDYVGNYYLCEKIEVDDNRLNIADLEESTEAVNYQADYAKSSVYTSPDGKICATAGLNNPVDITGGYLVEHIMANDAIPENSFVTDSGECYTIVSPNPASVEQTEYISGLFNEMETAMQQPDGIHPETGKHFSEYMDVDSWTSKYVIEEVFADPDALYLSMFFYKDADSVDSRIFSGPMWDYDRAMGSYGIASYQLDDPEKVGGYGIYVDEMMQHEEVRTQVYNKFSQLIVPYVEYLLPADVYNLSQTLEASAKMDRMRWPKTYGYYSGMSCNMDYLITFMNKKTDYLKELWLGEGDFCEVVFLDYYGDAMATYSVKRGGYLEEIPTIATWGGIFSGWYDAESGVLLDKRLPIMEDVTYASRWIELDVILQNGLDIAGVDELDADPEVFLQLAELLKNRQNQTSDGSDVGGEE